MLILLLADVATTEDALWAVVVFDVAVVAVKKVDNFFFREIDYYVNKVDFSRPAKAHV